MPCRFMGLLLGSGDPSPLRAAVSTLGLILRPAGLGLDCRGMSAASPAVRECSLRPRPLGGDPAGRVGAQLGQRQAHMGYATLIPAAELAYDLPGTPVFSSDTTGTGICWDRLDNVGAGLLNKENVPCAPAGMRLSTACCRARSSIVALPRIPRFAVSPDQSCKVDVGSRLAASRGCELPPNKLFQPRLASNCMRARFRISQREYLRLI